MLIDIFHTLLSVYINVSVKTGNNKGFAVPHNGIIFSENSEKISTH